MVVMGNDDAVVRADKKTLKKQFDWVN
jgi:hypothetical protein